MPLDDHAGAIRRAAERGEIPGRRIDGHWRFSRDGLLAWLAGEAPPSPAVPAN
jgi:hypothetical protein